MTENRIWKTLGNPVRLGTDAARTLKIKKATRPKLLFVLAAAGTLFAQSRPVELPATAEFPIPSHSPSIAREAIPGKPFSVIGPRGAILGQQDGSYEAWIFPWKIFSNLRITAEMKDYPVPIDLNEHAAAIEVQPDHTVITFSHANFTVREVVFAPHGAPAGAGVLVFYQIQAVRPMILTFHFAAEMKRMWPAPSEDRPSPEWVAAGNSGFYVLHLNFPDHAAALAMPGATHGVLAPYQERPKTYPLEFVLHFDPAADSHRLFPLLLTTGDTVPSSSRSALSESLQTLDASFQELYQRNQDYDQKFAEEHLSIETPDKKFDEAFAWAEIAIDQLRVDTATSPPETALVAGFFSSGDSSRPGFGWYFGRDSLWTLYAVNSYGDFQLTRNELAFLIHRQSPEGKIMHEWAQTSDLVEWQSLPYEFASADATPLLIMAVNDYLAVSGDQAFVKANWDALLRAWNFERSHDSDGDGIYENTEGTGWVESWPPGMPHQEVYLAVLDQQASQAFARLARAAKHPELSQEAQDRAARIQQQIEKEYFLSDASFYAFSRNADGSRDETPTIYPSVASWDGTWKLPRAGSMLKRWASSEFSTDWGTRDISPTVSFYDPISYHQGTVWPLFTGWVSLSEYRNGRNLSGYAHLMQNADLTWSQDLGAVTELLSGEFFQPLGRSTSHQLWSSAMVISPTLRGLFGLEWNASGNTLIVTPQMPASWNEAKIHHVPLGNDKVEVEIRREGTELVVRAMGKPGASPHLESRTAGSKFADGALRIPLPAVEVEILHRLPPPGSTTSQLKVLDQQTSPHSLTLTLSAPANSRQELSVRVNAKVKLSAGDADLGPGAEAMRRLQVTFPPGAGYVDKVVTLTW
jgi:glycogen debranching enzyme